jgi:hypothetical protein
VDVEPRQPLVDRTADRGVAGGQQHGHAVQRFREAAAQVAAMRGIDIQVMADSPRWWL